MWLTPAGAYPEFISPSVSPLILCGAAAMWPLKILPQTPLQLCGHMTLCTPGSCKWKSPGCNFQKSYCFPDKKKDNSTGTGFAFYPSPFLPAWVTEATPEGGVTLLLKRLTAVTLWWGRSQEPGPGCLAREATQHSLPRGVLPRGPQDILMGLC